MRDRQSPFQGVSVSECNYQRGRTVGGGVNDSLRRKTGGPERYTREGKKKYLAMRWRGWLLCEGGQREWIKNIKIRQGVEC